jgi:Na+/H+ antiporter NhaA
VCIFQNNEECVIITVAGGVKMNCGFVLLAVILWTSFQSGVQANLRYSTDIQALRVPVASRNYEGYIYTFPSM